MTVLAESSQRCKRLTVIARVYAGAVVAAHKYRLVLIDSPVILRAMGADSKGMDLVERVHSIGSNARPTPC